MVLGDLPLESTKSILAKLTLIFVSKQSNTNYKLQYLYEGDLRNSPTWMKPEIVSLSNLNSSIYFPHCHHKINYTFTFIILQKRKYHNMTVSVFEIIELRSCNRGINRRDGSENYTGFRFVIFCEVFVFLISFNFINNVLSWFRGINCLTSKTQN